nr:SLOG family protein [Sedimentibacter sp.]
MQLKTCCVISDYLENQYLDNHYYIELKSKLKERFLYMVVQLHVLHFMSGVNIGVEQCAVEALLELKKEYHNIIIECVLPYETLSSNWTELQRDRYFSIMKKIDKETLLQCHYTNDCIVKRNKYMVDKSKFIIKIHDNNEKSGIDNLISRTKNTKKIIFDVNINSLNVNTNIKICR